MAGGTKRHTIANLIPKEQYGIQVRAIDQGQESRWSNKHSFETISDATSGGIHGGEITSPEAPTLISWTVNNAGFVAVWNAISIMVSGKPTVITHYDMELADALTGQTKIFQFYTNAKPTVTITFTLSMMQGLFGQTPGEVTLRVRAVNSAGTVSDWSNSLTASMGTPDPPTNAVVVEAVDQLKISWTAPVNKNYLHGYRVYTGATAAFVPSPVNRIYQGPDVQFAYTTTTYSLQYFKIRSYSEWGTESTDLLCSGTPKSPFTIDVAPPAVPGLSGNLSTGGIVPRFAELSWTFNEGTPGNEDIAGFVIAWRKVGDTIWKQAFASEELRAISIELPLPYADYEFKIASYDKVGNYSAYSTPVLSLGGGIPGAPAQVTGVASTASLDTFRITWTPNTEGDVINGGHYDVDIATNSGFTTGLQSYSTANTEISIAGLLPNTTYYYRVRAEDVGGTAGIYSAIGNRLTPNYAPAKSDGSPPPFSPTVQVVPGIGYLSATWARVSNADLVTYEVHISTTAGFTPNSGTLVTETTGTNAVIRALPGSSTPLTYGTTYWVRLVAKDADGAAAVGVQDGETPLKVTDFDVSDVSAARITAGTVSAATIVLGTGGIFRTNNSDVIITDTGITVGANSSINAAAMAAGSAFVDDLYVQASLIVNSSGVIRSVNYAPGTTGYQLSSGTLDIRSGTIAAGTLVAGTITTPGIVLGGTGGNTGIITVDQSGAIRSNNYSTGLTGWQIASTGIEMNDANSQITVAALKTGSMTSTTFTVGSGGSIQSANWNGTSAGFRISDTGLVMYTGTIQGAAVYTNQIASLSTDPNSPLAPIPGQSQGAAFGINAAGKAVLSGALIYGNTVLGTSSAHQVASGNFISGSTGWLIRGDGYSEFSGVKIYGSATVGGSLSSISPGWIINGDGSSSFSNASMVLGNAGSGSIWLLSSGGNGQIRFYPPGHTPGVSGTFHYIHPSGANILIRGAFGAAVDLYDNAWVGGVGWVPNTVRLGINAVVDNALYVGGGMHIFGGLGVSNGVTFSHTLTVNNTTTINGQLIANNGWLNFFDGDPSFTWVANTGTVTDAEFGSSRRLRRKSSSLRYKENIGSLTYSPETILALEPKRFQYKDREFYGNDFAAGFIAEDADALGLDEFVMKNQSGQPDSFAYSNFVSALQLVNRAQQAEIDDLTARIEALEA